MFGKKSDKDVKQTLENIPFEMVSGTPLSQPITLFALSTCGFCRRAIEYLDELGYAYRFVHMDKLPRDKQDAIRTYVKRKYRTTLSFPFLCLGESDFLTGFIRASWEKELERLKEDDHEA